MTLHRRTFLGLSTAVAAAASAGWKFGSTFAQDATPEAAPDPMTAYGPVQGKSAYNLAFMQVFPSNAFWQLLKEGIEARAAEDGGDVDVIALPGRGRGGDQV